MSLMPKDLPTGYVYMASPYTHPDVFVREQRFLLAVRACAYAFNTWRTNITNSIVFTHPILTRYTMPVEWEFWASYDESVIKLCQEIWVLCIPGYTHSMGLNSEVKLSEKYGLRVRYMVPRGDEYELVDERPREEDLYGEIQNGRLVKEKLSDETSDSSS